MYPKQKTIPRMLPERPLPAYAYLPGRFPHPTRDPSGHSHEASPAFAAVDADAFAWGVDLFNYGYYWEAHEAWEGPWRQAAFGSAERNLLQGLILLAATGIKLRERKLEAARRHGRRAARFFTASKGADSSAGLSPTPHDLGQIAEAATKSFLLPLDALIAFSFVLACKVKL